MHAYEAPAARFFRRLTRHVPVRQIQMFTSHCRKPPQPAMWKFTAYDRGKNAEIVSAPPFCGDIKKMFLTPRTLTRPLVSARFDETVHSPVV
jgi:hypothetical protein